MSFIPGMFPMGTIGQTIPLELSYVTNVNAAPTTATHTFVNVPIGSANATRRVIVIIHCYGMKGAGFSVTIGGVSATTHITMEDGEGDSFVAIVSALIPTGTVGDIAVTVGTSAPDSYQVAVYRLINAANSAPYATASNQGLAATVSTTINVPENGFVIGAHSWDAVSATGTVWTGVNEDYDTVITGSILYSAGSITELSAETGRTIQAVRSGTTAYEGPLVAISWV